MIEYNERLALTKTLMATDNPDEALRYILENFDLKGVRLNATTKPLFVDGAIKAIDLCGAKRKK